MLELVKEHGCRNILDEGLCNNKKLQYTKRKGVQSMGVEINMDATLDRLFAGFKKLSPLLVGIGVTTGLILFLPQNVLAKMALDKLPDEKKIFIGMTFIISVALIIVIVGFQVVENVLVRKKKIRRWQSQKRESYIRLAD
ncbi:super-infection exclusion protein B [Faecalibacterium hattorii]|uniref:super-infection exclusion protein B n=1 Tax=Faecalibacterium hattorii TaxID=2935520 RepID=UPI003AAEBB55